MDLPRIPFVAHFAIIAALVILTWRHVTKKSNKQLPPGPRRLPLIGNALQMPTLHPGTYFRKICAQHGGLVSLKLGPKTMIVIGEPEMAREILEKRSAKSSSRPHIAFFCDHIDPEGNYWGLLPPGRNVHVGRKLLTQVVNGMKKGYAEPTHELEALVMLRNLTENPEDWFQETYRVVQSTTTRLAFGVPVYKGDDPRLVNMIQLLHDFTHHMQYTSSIINLMPWLDRLPIPKPWRKTATEFRALDQGLFDDLFHEAFHGQGKDRDTWAKYFASEAKPEGNQLPLLKMFAGAAVETTSIAIQTFVLACIRHPQWIAAAHQELDRVCGPDRLPTFSDREHLPYIEAVMRESLRWRTGVRVGVPHEMTDDDYVLYKGKPYFLPKGSAVVAPPWVIDHDPARYNAPDVFMPSRFLDEKGALKSGYQTSIFGYGRRMCPGSPMAERSLWITLARLLWMFDILPVDGYAYRDDDEVFGGLGASNPPDPFPARFQPRSVHRVEVAQAEWTAADMDPQRDT